VQGIPDAKRPLSNARRRQYWAAHARGLGEPARGAHADGASHGGNGCTTACSRDPPAASAKSTGVLRLDGNPTHAIKSGPSQPFTERAWGPSGGSAARSGRGEGFADA
jgi:hypothetical protein